MDYDRTNIVLEKTLVNSVIGYWRNLGEATRYSIYIYLVIGNIISKAVEVARER